MMKWWRRRRIARQVIAGLAGLIARHQERQAEIGVTDWIYTAYGKFYMRISRRLLWADQRGLVWCVDIASVDIDEQFQRQGLFKAALTAIEDHTERAGYDAVMIESVLNENLEQYLINNRGYRRKTNDALTYFKRMNADD